MVNVWKASSAPPIGLISATNATVMVPRIAPTVRAAVNNSLGKVLSGSADVGRSGVSGTSGVESNPTPNRIFESGGCSVR